ncbi:MAG: peptidoglycan-binding protein [bacterium]
MHTIAAKLGAMAIAPFMLFSAHAQTQHAPPKTPAPEHPKPELSCTTLEHNLSFGSRDSNTDGEVSELQAFLRADGYLKAAVSGTYGAATARAVASFQRDEHIAATGSAGPKTRAAIESASCGEASADLSISGIDAPTALAIGAEGTWIVNVDQKGDGNLRYSVKWGDEGKARMMALSASEETSSSATFTHAYDSAGTYAPEFTVTDESGHTATKVAATVTVGSEAAAAHIASIAPKYGYAGATATLTGTGFLADSKVSFGGTDAENVTVISDTSVTFTVPAVDPGTYDVALTNGNGTSNAVSFKVIAKPAAKLSISGIDAPVKLSVDQEGTWTVHADTNTSGSLHYSVTWGDEGAMRSMLASKGTVQTSSTFTHSYAKAGTYAPKFTVSDDSGKSASVSATVVVRAK